MRIKSGCQKIKFNKEKQTDSLCVTRTCTALHHVLVASKDLGRTESSHKASSGENGLDKGR